MCLQYYSYKDDKIIMFSFSLCHVVSVVEVYEISGKHTFLPMGIVAMYLLVLLLLLAVFYKELAPKSTADEGSERYHVNATFGTSEQDKGLSLNTMYICQSSMTFTIKSHLLSRSGKSTFGTIGCNYIFYCITEYLKQSPFYIIFFNESQYTST